VSFVRAITVPTVTEKTVIVIVAKLSNLVL
jgi:hypothetical protein